MWRWWRPTTFGVRVLALDSDGRLLLVRHSYGSPSWMPPGGGMKRGEDPLLAAARELREETGLVLERARVASAGGERLHGARHTVSLVAGEVAGIARPDQREIIEAAFFAFDALPDNMPPVIRAQVLAWRAAT